MQTADNFIIVLRYRSVLGLTDDQQTLQNNYQYDPFGTVIASEENVPNAYQYIGQWGVRKVKESTGLYFMRARFYDSRHGRFLTLDPYGISGKSTNIYSYANNNPLENIDPKGTALPAVIAGVIVSGGTVNTGLYILGQLLSGDEITTGALVVAFSSGAVRAGLLFTPIGLPGSLLAGGTISATGNVVTSKIDGKEVEPAQLLQETIVGILTAGLPIKSFLYSRTDASKYKSFFLACRNRENAFNEVYILIMFKNIYSIYTSSRESCYLIC